MASHAAAESELEVIRRSDRLERIDDRRVRAAIASGEWIKVTAGAFVRRAEWEALSPIARHRTLVAEVLRRRRVPVTVSHYAAAAIWDIDVLASWPSRVDVLIPSATGGRSSGLIRRRFGDGEHESFGEHFRTTAAQTALDIARISDLTAAVAVIDSAIGSTDRAPKTSISQITRVWEASAPHRGDARVRRALELADPLAANVRESQLRILMIALGFPRARVQEYRYLRSGREVWGDLYVPEFDHWIELDGRGKYLSPQFAAERTSDEIVIDEKNRENEIRREVRGFTRFEPWELDRPRRVYDILVGDGLPSSRPRP